MTTHSEIVQHNVATVVRLWREGGRGWILLPGSKPGTLSGVRIEHDDAEEAKARYLDLRMVEIAARELRGEALSDADRKWLEHWRESVPHSYGWLSADGVSIIIPRNFYEQRLCEGLVLAAHPSEYAEVVHWIVPAGRSGPGFRGYIKPLPQTWRRVHVATLRFAPGVGMLTAWTLFERMNETRTLERLSPEDRLRYFSPYGMHVRDGRAEVFNRFYSTIHERPADGAAQGQLWFYDDECSEAEKRRRAEVALKNLGIDGRKH